MSKSIENKLKKLWQTANKVEQVNRDKARELRQQYFNLYRTAKTNNYINV